jgi:hypothetical protein
MSWLNLTILRPGDPLADDWVTVEAAPAAPSQ